MRYAFYLKKKGFWILVVLLIILGRMGFGYFGTSINLYTIQLSKEYSEKIVSQSLSENILSLLGDEGVMKKMKNDAGNVVYTYVDAYKANQIRIEASKSIAVAIDTINMHKDFQKISLPLGYFFSQNVFLSNGIKVPINLEVVGSHKAEIKTDVVDYGINSCLIETSLEVEVEVQIAIPFQAKSTSVVTKIPLSIEVINSEVPRYYFEGASGMPGFILEQ